MVLTVPAALHTQCQITARKQQRTHAHAQHRHADDDDEHAPGGGHPGTPASKGQKPELTAKGAHEGECQRLKRRRTQDGNTPHLAPEHRDRGVCSALNKLDDMRSPCARGEQGRSHRKTTEGITQTEWRKRSDPGLVVRNKRMSSNGKEPPRLPSAAHGCEKRKQGRHQWTRRNQKPAQEKTPLC